MSRVVITIDDVPATTSSSGSISANIRYPQGKRGIDKSLAEAVASDFKSMLAGKSAEDWVLEYVSWREVRRGKRLRLIVDNVTETL